MMERITPPRRTDRYPDRGIDYQETIEAEFQKPMQIENLADKMAREENARLDAALMLLRL
jgi:hypothetical protein